MYVGAVGDREARGFEERGAGGGTPMLYPY